MSEKEGRAKAWVTSVTIGAPVLSAIIVAVLTQLTNVRLAEMEHDTKASEITIEQNKLRDQQELRRQQFLVENIPKILSSSSTDRQIGRALLLLNYPSEAADILDQIVPAASGSLRESLEAVTREAIEIQKATGDWAIVVSGDKELDPAKWEFDRANRLNFKPVSLYFRDGFYRTVVGNYPNRQVAEQAAIATRPQTRSDAYVVALGRWCKNPENETKGNLKITVCSNGK